MLSVSLKNFVLFFFVILILHYIISNTLDNQLGINSSSSNDKTDVEVQEEVLKNVNMGNGNILDIDRHQLVQNKVDLNYARPEKLTSNNELRSTQQFDEANINNINLKQKELYDFVYDDNAKVNLNTFYEVSGNYEKSNARDPEIRCADNICSNKNFCNTTSPTAEEVRGHYSGFNRPQCEQDIKDNTRYAYLDKRYGNDSANGNNMGIGGFDSGFSEHELL